MSVVKLNLGPLNEQPVLLTAEPSPAPLSLFVSVVIGRYWCRAGVQHSDRVLARDAHGPGFNFQKSEVGRGKVGKEKKRKSEKGGGRMEGRRREEEKRKRGREERERGRERGARKEAGKTHGIGGIRRKGKQGCLKPPRSMTVERKSPGAQHAGGRRLNSRSREQRRPWVPSLVRARQTEIRPQVTPSEKMVRITLRLKK